MSSKCVLGCKVFSGGDVKHHPACPEYKESISGMYDSIEKHSKLMHFEVTNLLHAMDCDNRELFKKSIIKLKILTNYNNEESRAHS